MCALSEAGGGGGGESVVGGGVGPTPLFGGRISYISYIYSVQDEISAKRTLFKNPI